MMEPALSPDEPLRLEALHRMNVLDTPLEERFERITRLARRMLGTPIVAISLVDERRQWFKSALGHRCAETSRAISFCGHTILQDGMFVVPDARLDPRFKDNPLVAGDPWIVFYAGCPIRSPDGANIGVMCVSDTRARELTPEDLQVLRDLAALAETELRTGIVDSVNAALVSQLAAEHRAALIDPLTRVWNRQGIFDALAAQVGKAAAGGASFAIAMADIDRFKSINDTHGHGTGDTILATVVRRALGGIRSVDAIGRYGGDEFLIVLAPGVSREEAAGVFERVRRQVSEAPIQVEGTAVVVTTTIGAVFVAGGCGATRRIDDLLAAADGALYAAKDAGRDRVRMVFEGREGGSACDEAA